MDFQFKWQQPYDPEVRRSILYSFSNQCWSQKDEDNSKDFQDIIKSGNLFYYPLEGAKKIQPTFSTELVNLNLAYQSMDKELFESFAKQYILFTGVSLEHLSIDVGNPVFFVDFNIIETLDHDVVVDGRNFVESLFFDSIIKAIKSVGYNVAEGQGGIGTALITRYGNLKTKPNAVQINLNSELLNSRVKYGTNITSAQHILSEIHKYLCTVAAVKNLEKL